MSVLYMENASRQYRWYRSALVGMFAVAGVLGIGYHLGFPTAVNDETPPIVAALKMIGEPSWRPNFETFYYMPLSAYALLPFAAIGLILAYFFAGVASVGELQQFVILDFAMLLPAARVASVCFASAALYLFVRLAARVTRSQRIGLFAGIFLGADLLFMQLSHFGRVWSLQMLLIVASLWAISKVAEKEKTETRDYAIVGLLSGLSFGVHIIGATVLAALPALHAFREKGRRIRSLWDPQLRAAYATFLACIPVFYVMHPFAFQHYGAFFSRLVDRLFRDEGGGVPIAASSTQEGMFYYFKILLEYDPAIFLLGAVGILLLVRQFLISAIWLFTYGLAYWIVVQIFSIKGVIVFEPRYALPLVPIFAIAAALATEAIIQRVRENKIKQNLVFGLVIVGLLFPTTLWLMRINLPATRVDAYSWVLANVPNNEEIILLDDRIPLPENRTSIVRIASSAPAFFTKKRSYLLDHPELEQFPSYDVVIPSFLSTTTSATRENHSDAYALVSWWNPDDRADRLVELTPFLDGKTLEHLARFPADADDRTESIDLANNMRSPAWKLWGLRQNGPVVDIYRIAPLAGEGKTNI